MNWQFKKLTQASNNILFFSEENLTIVSTFVGDNHSDLEEDNDDDLDWDASRLSFFHVPDFHSHGAGISAAGPGNSSRLPSDEQYFEARLNELSRISHSGNTALRVSSQDPPPNLQDERVVEAKQEPRSTGQVRTCDKDVSLVIVSPTADTTADRVPDMTQPFSDRRYQQLLPGGKLSTFSSPEGEKSLLPESPQNEHCFQSPPLIAGGGAAIEEAHFLLSPPPPHQTRTCPDGSSNPDIDLVPLPRRSPGSGKSQSDPEEEGKMAALSIVPQTIEKPNTGADPVIKKKEGSTFGTLLARLFGSAGSSSGQNKKNQKKTTAGKRSKSCDKELESTSGAVMDRDGGGRQQHQSVQKGVKSASSSPMKTNRQLLPPAQGKRGSSWMQLTAGTAAETARRQEAVGEATTPSTLSLDTEWEFQAQERHVGKHVHVGEEEEDESNGNNVWEEQEPYSSLRYTAFNSPGLTGDKRKSSGYDSLESCSLDSMDNGHNSCPPAYYYDSRLLQQQPQQQQVYGTYAVPELWINNGGNLNNASRELDEVTLLKLEIGRHPDILNKNY